MLTFPRLCTKQKQKAKTFLGMEENTRSDIFASLEEIKFEQALRLNFRRRSTQNYKVTKQKQSNKRKTTKQKTHHILLRFEKNFFQVLQKLMLTFSRSCGGGMHSQFQDGTSTGQNGFDSEGPVVLYAGWRNW